MLFGFMSSGFAMSADSTKIVIGKNLRVGMTLKDAYEVLGPPENVKVSDAGTVIMSYDSLGISLEAASQGTSIEAIHVKPTFQGTFSAGIGIGADYQDVLSSYNQPDIMTKDKIEYSDFATTFHLDKGKVSGADLYSGKGTLPPQVAVKKTETYASKRIEPYEDKNIETADEEEAEKHEDNDTVDYDKYDVLALYGLDVKFGNGSVIVAEIRPGSVADKGGLKEGESIRRVFYDKKQKRNIYTVSGLKTILKRAVAKREKVVYILQDSNRYSEIEVPRRN